MRAHRARTARAHRTWSRLLIGGLTGLLAALPACLDPAVSDYPTFSHRLLPADAAVPDLDERLTIRLTGADGFDTSPLPPRVAFLDGQPIHFWDLGEANPIPQTIWLLRKQDTNENPVDFGHPPLVDQIPGDEGYSPLGKVQIVYVTTRYKGELITSFSALEDAIELGLAQEPADTDQVVQWPIARAGATLEMPDGSEVSGSPVYYRDHQVNAFKLEEVLPRLSEVMVTFLGASPATVYGLQRQNEAAVMKDNFIFSQGPATPGYTGIWTTSQITVAASYESGSIRGADALFSTDSAGAQTATDAVITLQADPTVRFWPLIP